MTFKHLPIFLLLLSMSYFSQAVEENLNDQVTISASNTVTASHVTNPVYLGDANINLYDDYDYDGYHSGFELFLDLDTLEVSTPVFVDIFIQRPGELPIWITTSDVTYLHGTSYTDELYFDVFLDVGFEPGYYTVIVDVYDAEIDHLLTTISVEDDYELGGLYLESSNYEESYGSHTHVSVTQHSGSAGWLMMAGTLGFLTIRLAKKSKNQKTLFIK